MSYSNSTVVGGLGGVEACINALSNSEYLANSSLLDCGKRKGRAPVSATPAYDCSAAFPYAGNVSERFGI